MTGGKDLGQVFPGSWCFIHSIKESSQEFAKQQGRFIQIKLVIKLERNALSRSIDGRSPE